VSLHPGVTLTPILDVFIATENWLRALLAHPAQEESCV
jgi:hypothetical protein